jgi:hypothetical protein
MRNCSRCSACRSGAAATITLNVAAIFEADASLLAHAALPQRSYDNRARRSTTAR